MKGSLRNFTNSKGKTLPLCFLAVCSFLIGAVIFVAVYGTAVLNPTYTDWLMAGGDLSQHYLGWCAFRASDWHFPIGLHDSLSYPTLASVIYTDSIPLFAVFFKLLSPILPDNFQYFGLWGILCYALQCMIGTILCRKYAGHDIAAILGGVLLTLSPVMIFRMYSHTALASHWLILLSWIPFVYSEKFTSLRRSCLFWLGMGILCSTVHLYLIPICGITLCVTVGKTCLEEKKLSACVNVVPFVLSGLLCVYLLGGFSSGASYGTVGFGIYNANLTAYFNPMGMAKLFVGTGTYVAGQIEGFGYLGAGVMALSILALAYYLQAVLETPVKRRQYLLWALPFAVVVLLSTCIAVIPNITFEEKLLFSIPFPSLLEKLMDIFRANGRFVWCGVYAVCIASLIVVYRKLQVRTAVVILALCTALQLFDLSVWLTNIHTVYSVEQNHESTLASDLWDQLAQEEFAHVYVSEAMVDQQQVLYDIADWAVSNGMTLNCFFFARLGYDSETYDAEKKNPQEGDLFIFYSGEYADYCNQKYLYTLDGFVIGCSYKLDYLEVYEADPYILSADQFYCTGQAYYAEEGYLVCEEGGTIYGPYFTMPAGTFRVTYCGSGLDHCTFNCAYENGTSALELGNVTTRSDLISYEVTFGEETANVEFLLSDEGTDSSILYYVQLEKIDME